MKAIEMNASKRSSCTILVSILVGAGCAASDNNSGSLRNDSAVADGSGQVARDTQARPADANPGYSPDAAAPDAASVGKDAATASPEAGAGHRCQLNANGVCSAVTSNTACTPFIGHRYDEGAGCYATAPTTLWCCATAAGASCAWPPNIGCYQVATDGGTVAYWTPGGGEGCDQSESAKVTSAPPCGTPLVDAAAFDAGNGAEDAAAPDVVSEAKDAAADSPEAGAAHQCQLNADGTCGAVTPNTACTPFNARRYDESAGCIATNWTTLWCCATAAGDSCGWPAATGCYQVARDGGTVTYWTPALGPPSSPLPGGQSCEQSESAKVASASLCSSTLPDAAAPPDAHVPVSLPLCATADDCCVTVDTCTATATLGGKAGWGPVPGTHAGEICLPCAAPPVQIQCRGGFCAGTRVGTFPPVGMEQLAVSHCGYVYPPDGGTAPATSPHAGVDGGLSYQTTWTCGSY